jgi:uncharacterized protein with HEPN domain
MPRNYKIYLNDILTSTAKIEEYTKDVSFEEFSEDSMREDAIIRNLITIGEAVKSIPNDIKSKSSKIEWEEVAGFRDILIHQYFGTDLETVWGIIKNDLPKLKMSIESLIKKL